MKRCQPMAIPQADKSLTVVLIHAEATDLDTVLLLLDAIYLQYVKAK